MTTLVYSLILLLGCLSAVNDSGAPTAVAEPQVLSDTSGWVNIGKAYPGILIDLKYATTDNFVEEKMYECGQCYLRREAALAIGKIYEELQQEALSLKMFDCYRPRPIQWKLWEKVPDPRYVADPRKGSMHNRGAAVDLTLVDAEGNELEMGTGFDYFGPKAYHTYTQHSKTIQQNRTKLKSIMEKYGFGAIRTEWWHYSYRRQSYPIADWVWSCE